MHLTSPMPFREALAHIVQRAVMPTDLSSADLAGMDAAVRARAFFSARNMFDDVLEAMKQKVQDLINPQEVEGVTKGETLAHARTDIREMLQSIGYQPDKPGTIEDLSSDQRIRLVLEMNAQMAQQYGFWRQGQSAVLLDAFPAQELYRAEVRKEPRDWPERWLEAGGEIFGGKMIALKNDPIWTEISAFGNPYPPFDYNSGMGIRDVSRIKAMRLGLIDADTQIEPAKIPFESSFPT